MFSDPSQSKPLPAESSEFVPDDLPVSCFARARTGLSGPTNHGASPSALPYQPAPTVNKHPADRFP